MMNQNKGTVYSVNKAEAEKEAEKLKAKLTPELTEALSRIAGIDFDTEGQLVANFCILDSVSKADNCFYSMEAYKAIEAACYNAYMLGKLKRCQ